MQVVPDVKTLADNTTLATANRSLDRERELDRADVRDAAVEQRAAGCTPDSGRVDDEGLHVASRASVGNSLGGRAVRQGVVGRGDVGVGVLDNLAGRSAAVRGDVCEDTGAGRVDVNGGLAGGLEPLLRAGEKGGGGGEVEDVGDLEDDVELGRLLGQELGVLERAEDGLDARDLGDLLRLLLRADEGGDVVVGVLGDGLKDRSTDETCMYTDQQSPPTDESAVKTYR